MPKHTAIYDHDLGIFLHHPRRRTARKVPVALRTGAYALTAGFATLLVLQMAYPRNLTTPLLRADEMGLGAMTSSSLERKLTEASNSQLTIAAQQESHQTTFGEAGISVDTAATKQQALAYSWRERLTPFSLFRRTNVNVSTAHDEAKMKTIAEQIAAKNNRAPKNAVVKKIKDSYSVTAPSAEGITYESEAVIAQLKSIRPTQPVTVEAAAKSVAPKVSTEQAEESVALLARQTSQKTVVKIGNKSFLVPAEKLKKFIAISYNEKKGLLQTRYDNAAITGFVTGLRDATYVGARPTIISSLDGEVTARSDGKNGQTISVEQGTQLLVDMLKKQATTVEIPLQTITATTQFSRSYTSTSRGLQILLQDWQSDTGVAAGVVVRELGGKGRTASLNGNQSFLLASVSKLYLANYLYDGMAAGSIKGSATYGTPTNVSTCIERMIVVSDNACFNNLGNAIGWGKISSHTAAQGFTSTNPNPAVYSTTAFDTADYMHKLQNGSLVTSAQRSQLLGYMQRQIYRGGIPLGSSGAVADKVGYFGAYRHDAAIVYHPKVTYVLVVLTNGGSNPQIADLARRVSNFMDK